MTIQERITGLSDAALKELIADFDARRLDKAMLLVVDLSTEKSVADLRPDEANRFTVQLLAQRLARLEIVLHIEQMARDGYLVIERYPANLDDADISFSATDKGRARHAELERKSLE